MFKIVDVFLNLTKHWKKTQKKWGKNKSPLCNINGVMLWKGHKSYLVDESPLLNQLSYNSLLQEQVFLSKLSWPLIMMF